MPKMQKATMKYVVSFNGVHGGKEYGDSDEMSCDFQGDDIIALAEEVIADDRSFPLKFRTNTDLTSDIVGWFESVDDDPEDVYDVAVMMTKDCFYS